MSQQAKARTAPLPTFQGPSPSPDLDPNLNPAPGMAPGTLSRAATMTIAEPPPAEDGSGSRPPAPPGVARDLPIPKLETSRARMGTSDTGSDTDPKIVAGLFIALVGIGVTAAAIVVKRARPGRKLRRPTDAQVRKFGTAVADLTLRFVELSKLSPALVDGIKAAGAVGQYIEDGPLTVPDLPDPGMPSGLSDQED